MCFIKGMKHLSNLPKVLQSIARLCCRLVCASALLGAVVFGQDISFTGLTNGDYTEANIPSGYGGLQWSNFTALRMPGCNAVKYEFSYTGYCHMTDVAQNPEMAYIYGENGETREGAISADTPFIFHSATLAAAWNNDVQLTVSGFLRGELRYTRIISLQTGYEQCAPGPTCRLSSNAFPVVASFGWLVDRVTFTATGGYSDGIGEVLYSGWHQPHVVFNSLRVSFDTTLQVPVDVRPGSPVNPINPRSEGEVVIAVLGSRLLDAQNVDPQSIRVGRNASTIITDSAEMRDINNDGQDDLVFHVRTATLGVLLDDRELCLTGSSYQQRAFSGCDVITVVPPPSESESEQPGDEASPSRPSRAGVNLDTVSVPASDTPSESAQAVQVVSREGNAANTSSCGKSSTTHPSEGRISATRRIAISKRARSNQPSQEPR